MPNIDSDCVLFDKITEHVCRITLNRPEAGNAQDFQLTYALNDAFDRAARDNEVKVIVLAGAGGTFCGGHDMSTLYEDLRAYEPVGTSSNFSAPGQEGMMGREEEIYLNMCWRWRNIPKPTIAQLHGPVVAGGLMLAWVCDLIVCSEDTSFTDPTVAIGICGVEYFAHPWEFGARKAKEMLFTAGPIDAAEAHRLGMVNKVVPRERLETEVLNVAKNIASKPSMALKLAKEAVNQTLDMMGQWNSIRAAFGLHQLAHSHCSQVYGETVYLEPGGAYAQFAAKVKAELEAAGKLR
jgi:enoyl-CoA hydratase